MKTYKFTLKVRDLHNPKELKKGFGKGVLYEEITDFKVTDEVAKGELFAYNLEGYGRKIMNEIMEVKIEEL